MREFEDELKKEPEESEGDFGKLLAESEETSFGAGSGEIFLGRVIAEEGDFYLLDIGTKTEARVPKIEIPKGLEVKVGALLPLAFVGGGREEQFSRRLSFKAALRQLQRETLEKYASEGRRIRARIFRLQQDRFFVGLDVRSERFPELSSKIWELLPYPANLPLSEVDRGDPRPLNRWFSRVIDVKVVSLATGADAVVSRRRVLEEDHESLRKETLEKTKEGETLTARVKEIREDDVLLDIHGVEGYLSQAEASWYKGSRLERLFKRGELVEVKILKVDPSNSRFTLSRRALLPHPADELERKFKIRSVVEGTVVKILPKGGCFVRVAAMPRREAYLPPYELDAEMGLKEGQTIKAMVTRVDRDNIRVVLSIRKYDEAQMPKIMAKYTKENQRFSLGEILKEE